MTNPSAWILVALGTFASSPACSTAHYSAGEPTGPTLSFPARFAEGEEIADAGTGPAPLPSGAHEGARPPPRTAPPYSPPDPEPIRIARYWEYQMKYEAGRVVVTAVAERKFRRPVATSRHLGRYAVELWIGHELIDRVRFDFPGLAADPLPQTGPRPLKEQPTLGKALVTSAQLLVPASPRATRAVLVDRATGKQQTLPWPPDEPLPPVVSDGAVNGPPLSEPLDAGPAAAD